MYPILTFLFRVRPQHVQSQVSLFKQHIFLNIYSEYYITLTITTTNSNNIKLDLLFTYHNIYNHSFFSQSYLFEKSCCYPFLSLALVHASAIVRFMLSSPSSYIFFIMPMMLALGSFSSYFLSSLAN